MMQLLHDLWATFRAWFARQLITDEPPLEGVEPEEEPIYHTMDGGNGLNGGTGEGVKGPK